MTDGPTDVEELYSRKEVYDPTLSNETNDGVRSSRPMLKLFPTRIEGRLGEIRRAIAVVGRDEGAGSQLAGAVEVYLGGEWAAMPATWSQLRTAADAELVYDAMPAHQINGVGVVYDSYTDGLLVVNFPAHRREQRSTYPPGEVVSTTVDAVSYRELPCPLCDNRNYGVSGRLCKRHWRQDYEDNLSTYESLSPKPLDESIGPHNTPPKKGRGIPADRTGDSATAAADTGNVDALIRDELLTPSQARVIELTAAGWNLHEIGREMGTAASTVAEHLKRARGKLTPSRRRLTWHEEMARSVPVVKVSRRQPSRSLLSYVDVSTVRRGEVVCPCCYLIVRRGLMRGDVCATCSETFSDSLSTNGRVVSLIEGQGHTPLFLERCV